MLTWEDDLEIHALRKRGWSIGCVSLSWPQGDGLNWLPLCGRGCAVVTV